MLVSLIATGLAAKNVDLGGEEVSVFAWLLSSRNKKSCEFVEEVEAASARRSGLLAEGATIDGEDMLPIDDGLRPNPATRSAAETGRGCDGAGVVC